MRRLLTHTRPVRCRVLGALVGATLLLLSAACTERERVTGAGPLPPAPTAYADPPGGRDVPVARPPEDVQELRVTVADGQFDADRYAAQNRATRLVVTARGGPYTLAIDRLLAPRQLPADRTTEIDLTLPDPGDYTMQLGGGATDTAVLNVRSAGTR